MTIGGGRCREKIGKGGKEKGVLKIKGGGGGGNQNAQYITLDLDLRGIASLKQPN